MDTAVGVASKRTMLDSLGLSCTPSLFCAFRDS